MKIKTNLDPGVARFAHIPGYYLARFQGFDSSPAGERLPISMRSARDETPLPLGEGEEVRELARRGGVYARRMRAPRLQDAGAPISPRRRGNPEPNRPHRRSLLI